MIGTRMPEGLEGAILEALSGVGYDSSLIKQEIDYDFHGHTPGTVQLAAFWKMPADQYTSAVAVQWMSDWEAAPSDLKPIGMKLWAPFGLVAKPNHCDLWDTLPASPANEPAMLEESISYSDLPHRLRWHEHRIGREEVQRRKIQSRQLALYEGSSSDDVFYEWAFHPTSEVLKGLLRDLTKGSSRDEHEWESKIRRLRLLLRFLAIRIALDKGKLNDIDRNSPQAILENALTYPTILGQDSDFSDLDLAKQFVTSMQSVNLEIIDGGTLSQILQMNGLPQQMRAQWKFYPTPADLAWRMVQGIPFELIDKNDLLIWDGTCGTGTLLVAALERLLQMNGRSKRSGPRISSTIFGNDQEPLLSDLTRINLELAAGDAERQQWNISAQNVLTSDVDNLPRRPSIILGNLPAKAAGRGPNYAFDIIAKYLSLLGPGGLISTVVPRTLFDSTGREARNIRERLLKEFEIYEILDLPQGYVRYVNSNLAVINGRKKNSQKVPSGPIMWKTLDPKRAKSPMAGVIPSQEVWGDTELKNIEPPLLVDLRAELVDSSVLSNVLGKHKIIEGITPGREGKSEVLDHYESEAVPYLVGQAMMAPFGVSWEANRQWIRYGSNKIFRARRSQRELFEGKKVVLNRRIPSGQAWISLAGIVKEGIYPSDEFVVIGPEPTFPCEFIYGLLNSSLINCWLKLTNPSQTIRIEACRSIPLPKGYADNNIQAVLTAANLIATMRGKYVADVADTPLYVEQDLIAATLELDQAVYDLYEISESIRNEVESFYRWHEKPRPGFGWYPEGHLPFSLPLPETIFTESQALRLRQLRELKVYRDLSEREERELSDLATKWQEAYIAYNRLTVDELDNSRANA